MDEKDLVEALSEALEHKNNIIRELTKTATKCKAEIRELSRKLTLSEAENALLRKRLEAVAGE